MTADHIQAIFWSITYILLIIHSLKYKTHGIPITAIFLNFAWETVALYYSVHNGQISDPLIIRLVWTFLDFIMVILFLVYETKFCENKKEKRYFFWGYFISLCLCVILFREGYMLLSCFAIDLIMAIAFLLFVIFKYPLRNRIIYFVGFTKLLGDLYAWLYYKESFAVNEIGILVAVCNFLFIAVLAVQNCPISISKYEK